MAATAEVATAGQNRDVAELLIVVVAGIGLALTALYLCILPLSSRIAGTRDFVSYWAAGKQLVQHANPYDRAAIAAIEHASGLDQRAVLVMRNPPWALPLTWPLGFMGLRTGGFLWSLLLLACLVSAVLLVRGMLNAPPGPTYWLGLAFMPAFLCMTMGQTALLALLGLVLFLRYHAERPFAAGVALWLCMLKPHLFLPFATALFIWMLYQKAWRIAAGTLSALAISSAAACLIAPHAWADYLAMMRSPYVENDAIPCLAYLLRSWLRPQAVWIQYVPAAACTVWTLFYFWPRRKNWDWMTHGATLMLVSLVAAPYCWLYDQCLAIPALVSTAYKTPDRRFLSALAGLILVADLQIGFVKIISPLWAWTTPAWLVWYLVARASSVRHHHNPNPLIEP
jgi:Glycosyltransferase family 87